MAIQLYPQPESSDVLLERAEEIVRKCHDLYREHEGLVQEYLFIMRIIEEETTLPSKIASPASD